MFVKLYPQYTTEKYYLLSELEEIVALCGLQDVAESSETQTQFSYYALYILWNQAAEPLETFLVRLQTFINSFKAIPKVPPVEQIICSIQTLLMQNEDFTATIEMCLNNVAKHGFYTVFIGVSDKPSSTVALEAVHDWFNAIGIATGGSLTASGGSKTCALVAPKKEEFLGFEDGEPDADSDVFQALCCSSDLKETNTHARCLVKHVENSSVSESTTTDEISKFDGTSITGVRDLTFASVLLTILAAILLYKLADIINWV